MLNIEDTEFYCFENHEDVIKNYIVSYLIREKSNEFTISDDFSFEMRDNYIQVYDVEGYIFIPGLKQLKEFLDKQSFDFDSFSKVVFEMKLERFLDGWWIYFISDVFESQLSYKHSAGQKYLGNLEFWYNRKGSMLIKTYPNSNGYGYISFEVERECFDLDLSRNNHNIYECFPDPKCKNSLSQHDLIRLIQNKKFEEIDKNDYEFYNKSKFIFFKYD
ncbi:MAG: hypothetical protein GJ671_00635 [Alteromonadaceae bacterium]|nr:hypothetical protein [Alteromonadaceae bacterium]